MVQRTVAGMWQGRPTSAHGVFADLGYVSATVGWTIRV